MFLFKIAIFLLLAGIVEPGAVYLFEWLGPDYLPLWMLDWCRPWAGTCAYGFGSGKALLIGWSLLSFASILLWKVADEIALNHYWRVYELPDVASSVVKTGTDIVRRSNVHLLKKD
jgi:hypothetical protein